jgi:hypothetical protein
MNDLLQAMQLIDKHSDVLPEGDYLELCKHLKNAYNQRADPVHFFDYDNFAILPIGPTQETFQYFHDYYFDKALNMDSDFIQGQISYLQKEFDEAHPIRRITKNVREQVVRHYCLIHGIDVDEVELGFSKKDLDLMCKAYVDVENDFRAKYRDAIEKKIQWLEQSDDRLDEL